MRLIRNLPDQLVIAHRPWFMALITGGFALIFANAAISSLVKGETEGLIFFAPVLLCALFFYLLVRPVRVVFDRPSNSVEVINTTLFSRSRITHRLDEIFHADLNIQRGQKAAKTQIFLLIPTGESAGRHPITDFYGGPNHGRIRNRINTWLKQKNG